MKDTHMVERYSQYLNRCMFLASDPFIKRKYQQFMSTKVVAKKETFYDRMEKDRQRREEMLKNNPALSSNGFSSYKTPVMGSDECRSVSSPPNNLLKSSQGGRKTPQLKNSVSSFTKGVISNQ
jgi:hypothetical protein